MAEFEYTYGNGEKAVIETDQRIREYIWVNQGYFMGRYYKMQKKNTSISWNGAAFFFPVQWFCYRKMYLEAAVIWLLDTLAGLFFWFMSLPFINKANDYLLGKIELTQDDMWEMWNDMMPLFTIRLFLLFALLVIVSLFANAYYLHKIEKFVAAESLMHKGEIAAQRVAKRGVNQYAVIISLVLYYIPYFFAYFFK